MRLVQPVAAVLVASAAWSAVTAQSPDPAGTTYSVVSVRPNTGAALGSSLVQRPDGGFTAVNLPVATLIARAYPPAIPANFVGLPEWGLRERWDVTATATRPGATADERRAMLRALLADRFKLLVHIEQRPRDVYELVPARTDGRVGPGLQKLDTDCTAVRAANEAARAAGTPPPAAPPPTRLPPLPPGGPPRLVAAGPPPPCTVLMVGDDLQGQGTLADLFVLFRMASGRDIVDRSGLTGYYQITLRFDQMAARRPPDAVAPPDAAPSVFTAVQEQLGLRLVAATVQGDTLVIDRLERPTGN